jgi:type IX secretion system PorP/SprF family membrane protein
MKAGTFLFALTFCISTGIKAQIDFAYDNNQQTIPYRSLLSLNPSFAGSNGLVRNQFGYRNQWPKLSGKNESYYNGFDAYLKSIDAGAGIFVNYSNISGFMLEKDISLVYAQRIPLKNPDWKIIPSLQLGYLYREVNTGRLYSPLQVPIKITPVKEDKDVGAGLLVNYKSFYSGLSLFHINQPDIGVFGNSLLARKISFYTAYNLHLSEKTLLNFTWNYSYQRSNSFLQFSANMVLIKHLIMGLGYSSGTNFFTNLGYRNNYFSIRLGYDQYLSRLSGITVGSWELASSINFRGKENRKSLTDFETW